MIWRAFAAPISVLFSELSSCADHDGIENTALPLELAGEKDCRARAAAILDEVGLADRYDHYPGQMSGGEQQRRFGARYGG